MEAEIESFFPSIHGAADPPSFILPALKCKVSSSPSLHKSLLCWTERGRGQRLSQPTSADDGVFIDQEGERQGGTKKRQNVCHVRKSVHTVSDVVGNLHLK